MSIYVHHVSYVSHDALSSLNFVFVAPSHAAHPNLGHERETPERRMPSDP